MNISVMKPSDIKDVKNVAELSWHDTYDGIIPVEVRTKFLSEAYNEDVLLMRLERSPFYVAKVENQVIGFANFSNKKENGNVDLAAIYLHPAYQKQGLGSALLAYGCDQLKPNQVFVEVESDNVKGKSFYEKKGFIVVDTFDDVFDGHILKTVRMSLDVSN